MTYQSLRSTWAAIVLGFMTAVLLASCGGGGSAQTTTGGALQLLPANGSAYGGVPFQMQVVGGRPPYTLSSSDPGVFPVPSSTSDSTFTVLPANPGVIDSGLPPGSLPIRTVNLTVRDSNGNSALAVVKVGQNFFTGYGISVAQSSCPTTTTSTTTLICAGGDTVIKFASVFNGDLYGGREYRIDVLQGNFVMVNPATGASGTSVGFTTDHSGVVTAVVRVQANTPSSVGVIRITDVATGTSTIETFPIQGTATNGALTMLPSTFTFTGPDSATCGNGQGTFFVFDGAPPYTAVSSSPSITVNYIDPYHTPGLFGITVAPTSGTSCPTGSVVVTDSLNNRGTVTVTSVVGKNAPPAVITPLSVQPGSISLGCGQSGSVSVVGGGSGTAGATPTYSVSSANPNVTASVTGNTVTIARGGPVGPGTGSTTSTVNVTDGTTVAGVSVTSPTTCP